MAKWASIRSIATRLICVMALVMVGFAHKPVEAAPLSVQLAAYLLPDGNLPSLCLTDDGSQPKGMVKDHGCDACRLSAAVITPTPPGLAGQTIAFSTVVRIFEREHRLVRALYPPSSGPRAPPVSVMIMS